MRLSLKKGAHAVLSRAADRKFGASRSFFARCGIPLASPSSLPGPHNSVRVPYVRTSVRGPKTMGEALRQLFASDPTRCSLGAKRSATQWRDLRFSGPFLEMFFDRAIITFQLQKLRSSVRYWMASAMWPTVMPGSASRSAMVRATFSIRSWARALRPCCCMALSRSRSASGESSQ